MVFFQTLHIFCTGLLEESLYLDIYIGFTEDMHGMADELLRLGREGKSVYRIPKKYYKKQY